jgi:hypothetical protein
MREVAKDEDDATSSDAQPGSAELAGLVGYSRAFALLFSGSSYTNWSCTNASVRATLDCFALNVEAYASDLCDSLEHHI